MEQHTAELPIACADFRAATGMTQEPYLGRWLLLCAAIFLVSALVYAVRRAKA